MCLTVTSSSRSIYTSPKIQILCVLSRALRIVSPCQGGHLKRVNIQWSQMSVVHTSNDTLYASQGILDLLFQMSSQHTLGPQKVYGLPQHSTTDLWGVNYNFCNPGVYYSQTSLPFQKVESFYYTNGTQLDQTEFIRISKIPLLSPPLYLFTSFLDCKPKP